MYILSLLDLIASTAALESALGAFLSFVYHYLLVLLLLSALLERLPCRDVLLGPCFDSRMISDLYLVQLDLVQDRLSQEVEDLLYVRPIFGRRLNKRYVALFGEAETLLKSHLSPKLCAHYSACLSDLFPTRMKFREAGPLDWASASHLEM